MLPTVAGVVYIAAAVGLAVIIGRAIRLADRHRPTRVPQLDDPLRRGTDLEPAPCPGSAHGECLRACIGGACGALADAFAGAEAAAEWDANDDPLTYGRELTPLPAATATPAAQTAPADRGDHR
jgi:hypothetical protein